MAQPNDDPTGAGRLSPIEVFALEAAVTDLFGNQQVPAGHELHDPNRLSREAADALTAGVRATLEPHVRQVERHWPSGDPYTVNVAVLPPDIAERYRTGLLAGIMGLATRALNGPDVAGLEAVASALTRDHYDEDRPDGHYDDGRPKHYRFHLEYGPLRDLANVAHYVAESVAKFEGNQPPGTYSSGTANDVRRVRHERLRSVHQTVRQNPALLGVETEEDVVRVFNTIVERLNDHFPSFMGSRETFGYPLPYYDTYEEEYRDAELERMHQAELHRAYLEELALKAGDDEPQASDL